MPTSQAFSFQVLSAEDKKDYSVEYSLLVFMLCRQVSLFSFYTQHLVFSTPVFRLNIPCVVGRIRIGPLQSLLVMSVAYHGDRAKWHLHVVNWKGTNCSHTCQQFTFLPYLTSTCNYNKLIQNELQKERRK